MLKPKSVKREVWAQISDKAHAQQWDWLADNQWELAFIQIRQPSLVLEQIRNHVCLQFKAQIK